VDPTKFIAPRWVGWQELGIFYLPHLLVNVYITWEAVASPGIEGTQASVTEIFDAAVTGVSQWGDVQEVRNYIVALEHGLKRIEEGLPISLCS
jgi:hypothetical protein